MKPGRPRAIRAARDVHWFCRHWLAGESYEMLGRRYGVSRDTVYRTAMRLDLPLRMPATSHPYQPDPGPYTFIPMPVPHRRYRCGTCAQINTTGPTCAGCCPVP